MMTGTRTSARAGTLGAAMNIKRSAFPGAAFTTTLARRAALDFACLAEQGFPADMETLCYDDLRMLAKGRGGTLYDGIKRLAGAIREHELELAAGDYRIADIGLRYVEASIARTDRPPPARPA